jgi:phosphate acyltransferase
MKIAVDAMGGDFAPQEIVKGAVQGAELHGVNVVLIGDEEAIRAHLPKTNAHIDIRHTTEIIEMGEHASAVRTKRDASVVIAADMVRDHRADAMISVGNTAAAMAVATLRLGRISGIDRPPIMAMLPHDTGQSVLLDAGAVADCEIEHLRQFAIMGSVYAEKVMRMSLPRVALLSIGEEPSKGNELTKEAHAVLEASDLNFIGNVEGRHLFCGAADVIVCDGFVGNVALKSAEGLGEFVIGLLKQEISRNPLLKIPLFLLKPAINRLKSSIDYAEYGGAPLLGLNGICIVGHGRSNARAVANAVKVAKSAVATGLVQAIRENIAAHMNHAAQPAVGGGKND